MSEPTDEDLLAYVQATAGLLGLPLDAVRARAVAVHLGRTAAIARVLDAAPLGPGDEPAELFRPAPFPPRELPE